jgi:hypothetical protein
MISRQKQAGRVECCAWCMRQIEARKRRFIGASKLLQFVERLKTEDWALYSMGIGRIQAVAGTLYVRNPHMREQDRRRKVQERDRCR